MTEHHPIDTLAEFHLHNPPDEVYALIAHLISILESANLDQNNVDLIGRNVSNILGEIESIRIMQVICQHYHVDYLELMHECQTITAKRISPRLLLHLICLPVPYVAYKLEIDPFFAAQLLEQLRRDFTIDAPLEWLKNLLTKTELERLREREERSNQLRGMPVVKQARDTHEYDRANKQRRLSPRLKPPDWT